MKKLVSVILVVVSLVAMFWAGVTVFHASDLDLAIKPAPTPQVYNVLPGWNCISDVDAELLKVAGLGGDDSVVKLSYESREGTRHHIIQLTDFHSGAPYRSETCHQDAGEWVPWP